MRSVCIGVDLGGTNLRCALVASDGAVLARERVATDAASGPASLLSLLLQLLRGVKKEAEESGMRIAAAGVAVPGLVSGDGDVLESVNLPSLRGTNPSLLLAPDLGVPVVTLNDANAGAVGEARFGAGRRHRSLMRVSLGTGVGAGLILDGKLWTGADGAAGEFGHITVEPNGRLCGCGNRGCLEQYLSAGAIAAQGAGGAGRGEAPGAKELAARARQGEPVAAALFEQAGSYLGIAAAGILNLLNLEAIILGGGLAGSFDLLLPPMQREIALRALAVPGARVRILKGELGDDAGVIGAAATARARLGEAPTSTVKKERDSQSCRETQVATNSQQ